MKFLKDFLTNLVLIIVPFVIVYYFAHAYIDAGFQIISATIGRGLSYLILFVVLLVVTLPRK